MSLRTLWRITTMSVMHAAEYRGAQLIYVVSFVIGPLISLLVWLTISAHGVSFPYSRSEFITYYVMLTVVSMLTASWLVHFLDQDIRLGGLSRWLVRPAPVVAQYIGNNLGQKLFKLPSLVLLLSLLALLFRDELQFPTSGLVWLLFGMSLFLAAITTFVLDLLLGSLAFWVEDVHGVVRVKELVRSVLSGQMVPLALFPPELSWFVTVQPFRYTLSFPLEILTRTLTREDLAFGFAWQTVYCLGFCACSWLLWRLGVRRYTAVGA